MAALLSLILLQVAAIRSELSWNFEYDVNSVFHAYVFEREQRINTHPALTVKLGEGSKLCHIHLLPTPSHNVPSFITARVTDSSRGHGELLLNSTALYEARLRGKVTPDTSVYNLKIVAEDCGHPVSVSRPWSINVILVPTEYPVWSQRHYTFAIPATLPPGDIVGKVTAYAALEFDNSRRIYQLGDDTGMCAYAIDHPASSVFDINGHGVIRSRIRFTEVDLLTYEMNVTGSDCHAPVPRRSTVQVIVIVQPACFPHWQDLDEQLVYPALSGPQSLSTSAKLELCEPNHQVTCVTSEVVSRIKLLWSEQYIPQAELTIPSSVCDLDLLSLRAQRHSCGFSVESAVELLPQESSVPVPNSQWSNLPSSFQQFNGSFQWTIPDTVLPLHQHRLDNIPFTLTFWMNHTFNPSQSDSLEEVNRKEHIICSADGEGKNRHHFAVFLHNCKLVMLLRREPVDSPKLNHLYPSQWRFSVDEVCDNNWHHYALIYQPTPEQVVKRLFSETGEWHNVEQLKLYVDGELVTPDSDLVNVAEDLPLRRLKRTSQITRISVGACWHSGTHRYVQHFIGQLTGLVLSRNVIEPDDRLQCLTNCIPRLHLLGQATDASRSLVVPTLYQSSTSNLIINASDAEKISNLIRKVVFYNPRIYKKPESRPEPVGIHINTVVRFKDQCSDVHTTEKFVQISHLPLTKQAQSSLRFGSIINPTRLIGTDGPVEPASGTSYSLVLQLNGSQNGLVVTEVSDASLYQGVWIFPSVDLQWEKRQRHRLHVIDPDDFASSCELDLCETAGYLLLQPHEEINISTEFLQNGLRFEKSYHGFHLIGPAKLAYIKTALQHIRWYNDRPMGMRGRCFQLRCLAEIETIHYDGSIVQLKVESNTVHSVLRIRYLTSVNTEQQPFSQRYQSETNSSVSVFAHEHIAERQQAPRVLRDLARMESTEFSSKSNLEDSRQAHNHIPMIIAVAIAGILVTIAGIVLYSKFQANRHSAAYESQWEPVDSDPFVTTSSTKRRSCGSRNRYQAPFADSLQLIVNPVDHPKELEEMQSKFCFYDPKIYDGETVEFIDGAEIPSDVNEDLSDFDGVPENETASNTELCAHTRDNHTAD